MKKKLNKKFEEMLKLSVKPFLSGKEKEGQKKSGNYSGKKTHQHNTASV